MPLPASSRHTASARHTGQARQASKVRRDSHSHQTSCRAGREARLPKGPRMTTSRHRAQGWTARHHRLRAITTLISTAALTALATQTPAGALPSSTSPVTLTVQAEAGTYVDAFGAVATAFEKLHPNIKIQVDTVPVTALKGSNAEVLSSTNPPDLGFVQLGDGVYSTLVAHHDILSMKNLWDELSLSKRLGPKLANYYKIGGIPYALDVEKGIFNVVFYNKTDFQKAGITAPPDHLVESSSQFMQIVSKLRKAGLQPLAFDANSTYLEGWLFDDLLPTAVSGPQFNNLLSSWQRSVHPTISYTSPQVKAVLAMIDRLAKDGAFADGWQAATDTASAEQFVGGKIAMDLGTTSSPAAYKSSGVKFPVGWVSLPPVVPGHAIISNGGVDTLVIPKHASNVADAEEFLKFMANTGLDNILPRYGFAVPYLSVPSAASRALGPLVANILTTSSRLGYYPAWDTTVPAQLGQPWENPELQKMILGQISPTQAAAAFQARFEALRQGKLGAVLAK